MFDIGFSELALVAVLALVIAGPERLPGIMRGLGRLAGRARDVYATIRTELEREIDTVSSSEHQDSGEKDSENAPHDGDGQ